MKIVTKPLLGLIAIYFYKNILEKYLFTFTKYQKKINPIVSSANLYLTMIIATIVKSVDGNDIVIIECSNILNSEGFIKGKKNTFLLQPK